MFAQIFENLTRQTKGLELLEALQLEEYELLEKRDTEAVSALEFSIHELLRQLAVERDELKKAMHGTRLFEYADMLPEEEGGRVRLQLAVIDAVEQRCARQAEMNTALSLALLDQSHGLMTYLYEQVQPRQNPVYGARGNITKTRPEASLLNGRL